MPELPHPAWPLAFATRPDGTVGFATVEQGTDEDRMASAAVIACTPRGHRDDDPTFGVTSPVFAQGPVDADRLAAEIAQSDPRLDLTVGEVLDLANATRRTVRLSVSREQA